LRFLKGAVDIEEIVAHCLEAGLVQGKNRPVEGRFIEANASKQRRIPREQLAERRHRRREFTYEMRRHHIVGYIGLELAASVARHHRIAW
jgi:hypothetical protein